MPLNTKSEKLGLALSGGGFRATLFHLGVVRALAETGLLARVTHITSVSGGSFLAAHLVLHWKEFEAAAREFEKALAEPPETAKETARQAAQRFDAAAEPLLKFIESDVRSDILRKLPWMFLGRGLCHLLKFFCLFSSDLCDRLDRIFQKRPAVESLRRHLKILFGDHTLSDLKRPGVPQLAILATEVASMELAWFTADGFGQPAEVDGGEKTGSELFTIAQSVAASSAFPALFPPIQLDGKKLRNKANGAHSFVTDAGVYDNLGIGGFHKEPFGENGKADYPVFVSDATATSDWEHDADPGVLTNLFRSVDIMQQRAAQLQRESVSLPQRDMREGNASPIDATGRFLLFDIARGTIKTQPMIADTLQRNVSFLRTDLDAFSPDEMRMLVHHGYSVAWHSLIRAERVAPGVVSCFADWREHWPRTAHLRRVDHLADELKRGARSRAKFFRFTEPLGAANALVACLLISIPILVPKIMADYRERKETARKTLERQEHARLRIESYAGFSFAEKTAALHVDAGQPPPDPGYMGVTIKSFEKTFDLRQWVPVPKSQLHQKALEPAWQQTVYSVRRKDTASKTVRFRLRTSGVKIDCYVPTLATKVFLTVDSEENLSNNFQLDIDLQPVPQGYDYPIFVRGCFWNGFQKDVETASFKVYVPDGEVGSMLVLFPPHRLPKRFNFLRESPSHQIEALFPVPFYVVHNNGIYFEVDRPEMDSMYTLAFTWSDQETGPMEKTGSLEKTVPTYDLKLVPIDANNPVSPPARPLVESPSKPENRL